jgi:hypothetical protein
MSRTPVGLAEAAAESRVICNFKVAYQDGDDLGYAI